MLLKNLVEKRHINFIKNALYILILIVCIYLLFAPFLPAIDFFLKKNNINIPSDTLITQYDSNIDPSIKIDTDTSPLQNTLLIPSIFVDGIINEGKNENTLNKGVWRKPNSSTPDKGGNTVLTAHRFQYLSGPNTFYSLDQVRIGDEFKVFWDKKEYIYKIKEVKEVLPNNLSVEEQTNESIVTLYTCTPLWTSEKRLVVIGKLIVNS